MSCSSPWEQTVRSIRRTRITWFGSFPVAAAIDSTGTYLYVASTLQPGFTRASPGPGTLTIFPINPADGTLNATAATSVATGNNPIGVTSSVYPTGSQTHYIYVADRETVTPSERDESYPHRVHSDVRADPGVEYADARNRG